MERWWHGRAWLGAALGWIGLVCLGSGFLIHYARTPGQQGDPPALWPAAMARDPGAYTLVLAAHPHCPCTRASLDELETILLGTEGKVRAKVLFVEPAGFGDDWARTDLWRHAAGIPGAQPILDPRGALARQFGALTSGQTALYDPSGRLVFSGGITGARGEAGPNRGEGLVLASIQSPSSGTAMSPVYGCPLHSRSGRREEARGCIR